MNKHYLITIENGFLVYQPESDIVYRGKRKTADFWQTMRISRLSPVIGGGLGIIADSFLRSFNFSEYIIVIYTLLMIIFGIIYYKYVYTKNKIKLLCSPLETVKISDIKKEFFKYSIETFILAILIILFMLFACLYILVYLTNIDKGAYLVAMLGYTICIPMLTIELELKGRFLLVKHLLKLNN